MSEENTCIQCKLCTNISMVYFVTGGIPPSRWIVNYDFDLLDGLVLSAVLGAHMPFLVSLTSTSVS